jgi:hypothetical protein
MHSLAAADNMVSKTFCFYNCTDEEEPSILYCPDSETFDVVLKRSYAVGVYRVIKQEDGSRHVVRNLLTKYSMIEENGLYVLSIPCRSAR